MKPLIGLPSQRYVVIDWRPKVHGQRWSYVNAIIEAGGLPIILPQITDKIILRELYERLDGILLCGGQDVDPQSYDAPQTAAHENIDRCHDEVELQLIEWALADGKPLLGVCRGLQIMNVAFGGSLFGDLPTESPSEIDHRACNTHEDMTHTSHDLLLESDSRLAAILGSTRLRVNSLHHQAIKKLGHGLRVVGRAEDGMIEAVELESGENFFIGVQHHPETYQDVDPVWRELFKTFVDSCSSSSEPRTRRAKDGFSMSV
jgi:putative glutamine amidotransferase